MAGIFTCLIEDESQISTLHDFGWASHFVRGCELLQHEKNMKKVIDKLINPFGPVTC